MITLTRKGRWIEITPKLDEKLSRYIDKTLSYSKKGSHFLPNPAWGIVRLYNSKKQIFPYGLLSRVEPIIAEWCKQTKQEYRSPIETYDLYALSVKGAREYQTQAIAKLIENNGGIVVAATGSGKTFIGVSYLYPKAPFKKILIVVPTKDLVKQWSSELTDKRFKDVQVKTYQYLIRHHEDLHTYDIVVFDECHHTPAKTMYKLGMLCHNAIMVGLSATPKREDGEEMKMHAVLGDIVYTVPIQDMVEKGYLVQAKVHMVDLPKVQLTPEDDYARIYQKAIVNNSYRNEVIVKSAINNAVMTGPTIVLVDSLVHGQHLLDEIKKDIKVRKLKLKALFIQGGTKDREEEFQNIKDGEYDIIVASKIFNEGVNFPALQVLILGGGGKGTTKIVQQVGRILRPHPGKEEALIIDFKDDCRILKTHTKKRMNIYKDNGFKLL